MKMRWTTISLVAPALAGGALMLAVPFAGAQTPDEIQNVVRYKDTSNVGGYGWGGSHRSVRYTSRPYGVTAAPNTHAMERAKAMEDMERQKTEMMEADFWKKEYQVPAAYGTLNPKYLSDELKQYIDDEKKAEEAAATTASAREQQPAPEQNVVEDAALAQIQAMSDYMASLKTFGLEFEDIREDITPSGPVSVRGYHAYVVSRPDRFILRSTDRGGQKDYEFDGKTLTMVQKGKDYEASIPADGDLNTVGAQAYAAGRLVLPVASLLRDDLFALVTEDLTQARYVGVHYISGHRCHHIIGTTAATDWQVWVDAEGPPAPRRVLVRYRGEQGAPRYAANIKEVRKLENIPGSE